MPMLSLGLSSSKVVFVHTCGVLHSGLRSLGSVRLRLRGTAGRALRRFEGIGHALVTLARHSLTFAEQHRIAAAV